MKEKKWTAGEGAQSLQNIWLEGEAENTPGKAGTASPGIPNMSTISMNSSNTTEVVNIEFVASEEQTRGEYFTNLSRVDSNPKTVRIESLLCQG